MSVTHKGKPIVSDETRRNLSKLTGLERFRQCLIKEKVIDKNGKKI